MRKSIFFLICLMVSALTAQAASVNVQGKVNASSLADGVEVVLTGNTELFVDANKSINKITGDYTLDISGDRTLTIKSKKHGISVTKLISAANLNITSSNDGLNIDQDIIINGGKIDIDADGDGIFSRKGGIYIQNATIVCGCGTNMTAILSKLRSINIADSRVEAHGAKYGIMAESGSITMGGNIQAGAGGWAIVAQTDITFTDGNIVAQSSGGACTASGNITINANVETQAFGDGASGMYAGGTITVNSGTVKTQCSKNGWGMGADGNIEFKGGTIDVGGAKYGIRSDEGRVIIKAPVNARASGWALTAAKGIGISYPYAIQVPAGGSLSSNGTMVQNSSGNPATNVQIYIKPLSGNVYYQEAKITVGTTIHCTLFGEVADLPAYGVTFKDVWQVSDDGENNWTTIYTGSNLSYSIPTTYLGKYLRVRVTANECDGVLYSPVRLIVKSPCTTQVEQASLKWDGTYLNLQNPKTNQEYFLITYFKNLDQVTESDWASSSVFVPTSTSSMRLTQAQNNKTNYVYTRVRGTSTTEAGTDVRVSFGYAGEPTYLQNIRLDVVGVTASGTEKKLDQELRNYYTKVGDVVKITAYSIPDNASNYNGIFYSSWICNAKAGTFYANYQCTQTLQSGSYYKTVYFKPSKQTNYCDIAAEFTKGYNDIAHDAINLVVANSSGQYMATSIQNDRVYITKGETLTGIAVDAYPKKATTSNFVYTFSSSESGSGTAPIVTAQSDGTVTVNAKNATLGTYYYTVTQNGNKVIGGFSVQVTNVTIEAVHLSPTEVTAEPGDEFQLVAQLIPANSGDVVSYSCSNYSVATVTSDGLVKIGAKAEVAAKAVITANAGGKTATCNIVIAGKKFEVRVNGTQVTTRNMDDVLGDGNFTFDGMSTLTVKGDFDASKQLIVSEIPNLTIDVPSDAHLSGTAVLINLTKDATITGKGQLTLTYTGNSSLQVPAIQVANGATLTLLNANVVAEGGVMGAKSGSSILSVEASTLHATADDSYYAVGNFKGGILLSECTLQQPAGAKIDNTAGAIVKADGTNASDVLIKTTATAVDDIATMPSEARKLLIDGNLYIHLPDGRTYNILGVRL